MSFSVNVEEYSNNISADVSNVTIALITDSGSFTLRDGEITGKKAMIIGGFSGSFSLNKNNFSLAGLSTKLELTELGVSFSNMPINGSADYWSVSISQIALSNLILENSTGSVNAKGVNMRVDNARIIIKNANASIYADAALSLHGVAHSIELPDSEIEIK
jgi:hypothetical protein